MRVLPLQSLKRGDNLLIKKSLISNVKLIYLLMLNQILQKG